jgi:hypothetical protein
MSKAINKVIKTVTLGQVDLDPKAAKQPDARAAPDPEAEAMAKSRALQRKKRSGRTSTVLTGGSKTLG